MSERRRRFLVRQRRLVGDADLYLPDTSSGVASAPPLDVAEAVHEGGLGWDEEQRRQAYDDALAMAERDPDGAALLLAQLDVEAQAATRDARERVAQAAAAGEAPQAGDLIAPLVERTRGREPFDPMRLFSQMARHYKGFDDVALRRLQWKRLLGYWRELVIDLEDEAEAQRRAFDRIRRGQGGRGGSYGRDPLAADSFGPFALSEEDAEIAQLNRDLAGIIPRAYREPD